MNETLFNWKNTLIAIVILVAFLVPVVVTETYLLHLISMSLIWIILTQGLNVIQGYTGYVSLAQASFFGIGAYASALLTMKAELSFWAALLLSVVITTLIGMAIGFPILRTKDHYFAIVTMAFCMITFIVMQTWEEVTGGDAGLSGVPIPEPIFGLNFAKKEDFYYLLLVLVLLVLFIVYRIIHSKIGRAMISIRENEPLAQSMGIALFKYKLMAFSISAALGGLSGSLYAHYTKYISPTPFALDYSLNAILAVILGGSGTIVGPIIGSFLLIFLPEYLRIAEEYRLVIYSLLLILITIYAPKGVIHLLQMAWSAVEKRLRKQPKVEQVK